MSWHETQKEEEVVSMKKAVEEDKRMNQIQKAVTRPTSRFAKEFSEQNPNIRLKHLKSDKQRFLKELSTNSSPLFGLPVIEAVIRAADKKEDHQGSKAIIDLLEEKKYAFYDEMGKTLDMKTTVDEFTQACGDCSEVQEIKIALSNQECVSATPEKKVLDFADKNHQGFAAAYRRVKSWVRFPGIKKKVFVAAHCSRSDVGDVGESLIFSQLSWCDSGNSEDAF